MPVGQVGLDEVVFSPLVDNHSPSGVPAQAEAVAHDDSVEWYRSPEALITSKHRSSVRILLARFRATERVCVPVPKVSDSASASCVDPCDLFRLPRNVGLERSQFVFGIGARSENTRNDTMFSVAPSEQRAAGLAKRPPSSLDQEVV
jgi:hypothetical protein